eukprot:GEMP01007344.1.p1 GENE.GEMP01007344.1~~GEMP01007344.1.p1  ORF type:complete len:982 (+),score=253.40 GEMP01007344.1:134-3079(+)
MVSLFSQTPTECFERCLNLEGFQREAGETVNSKVLTWDSLEFTWTLGLESPRSTWALKLPPGHDLKKDVDADHRKDVDDERRTKGKKPVVCGLVMNDVNAKSGRLIQDAAAFSKVDFVAPAKTMMRLFQAVSDPSISLDFYIHKIGGWLVVSEGQHARFQDQHRNHSSGLFDAFLSHSIVPQTRNANRFNQVGMWGVCGESVVTGSDLICVRNQDHPKVALYLQEVCGCNDGVNLVDCFLECVMAGVPEFIICFHRDGVVESYSIYKTKDVAEYLENEPSCLYRFAGFAHILKWLRRECKIENCTYSLRTRLSKDNNANLVLHRCKSEYNDVVELAGFDNSHRLPHVKNTFIHFSVPAAGLGSRLRAESCPARVLVQEVSMLPMAQFRPRVAEFYCRRGVALLGNEQHKCNAELFFRKSLQTYSANIPWRTICLICMTVLRIPRLRTPPLCVEKELVLWRSPHMDVACVAMATPKKTRVLGTAPPPQWAELLNIVRRPGGGESEIVEHIPRVWWIAAAQCLVFVDAEAALECLEQAAYASCCGGCLFGNDFEGIRCAFESKVLAILEDEEEIRSLSIMLLADNQEVTTSIALPRVPATQPTAKAARHVRQCMMPHAAPICCRHHEGTSSIPLRARSFPPRIANVYTAEDEPGDAESSSSWPSPELGRSRSEGGIPTYARIPARRGGVSRIFLPRTLTTRCPAQIAFARFPRKLQMVAVRQFGERFRALSEATAAQHGIIVNNGRKTKKGSAEHAAGSSTAHCSKVLTPAETVRALEKLDADIKAHGYTAPAVVTALADMVTLIKPVDWLRVGKLGDEAIKAAAKDVAELRGVLCSIAFRLRAYPPPNMDVTEAFSALLQKSLAIPAQDPFEHAVRAQCFYGLALVLREKLASTSRQNVRRELQQCGELDAGAKRLVGRVALLAATSGQGVDAQISALKEAVDMGIPETEVLKTIQTLARGKNSALWIPLYRTALASGVRSL